MLKIKPLLHMALAQNFMYTTFNKNRIKSFKIHNFKEKY